MKRRLYRFLILLVAANIGWGTGNPQGDPASYIDYSIDRSKKTAPTVSDSRLNSLDSGIERCRELNTLGANLYNQSDYANSVELFEEALSCFRGVGDRPGEASVLNNLGATYNHLGRYSEAAKSLIQSADIYRQLNDLQASGIGLNNLGSNYYAQGQYQEALVYYADALDIARKNGYRPLEGDIINNIGTVYSSQGRLDDALTSFEQALRIAQEVGDRSSEAIRLLNIGSAYQDQGRYSEGIEYYMRALAIHRDTDDRAGEARALNNIGAAYSNQGRYEEALAEYMNALRIVQEIGYLKGIGITLNNIGTIYFHQGRITEALDYFTQALVVSREAGDLTSEGRTLGNIASVYTEQGRYSKALESHLQVLEILRKVGDRAGEGIELSNIGLNHFRQEHYSEAIEYGLQALAIHRGIGDQTALVTTLGNIGATYWAQDRPDRAQEYFEQAMSTLEEIRTLAGSDQERMTYIAQHTLLYEEAIDLYLGNGQPLAAFFAAERARSRTFLDSLATGYVQLSDQELDQFIAQEKAAYLTRQALQMTLAQARAQSPVDDEFVSALQTDLREAQVAYEATVEAIVARGERLASLIPGRGLEYVLEVDEVQVALPAETTLVSYFLYTDKDNEQRAVAFVVGRDQFEAIPLPVGEGELSQALSDFRAFASVSDAYPISLRHLYEWLIEPIARHLTTPGLIIIPHGVLHYLPFTALTDGDHYLGERYVITTLPSASALPLLVESKPGDGGPLVLGNPVSDAHLDMLSAAEAEAEAVAELYNQPAYTGTAATESLVREQAGSQRMLHIASHAEFNPVAPLQSGLYLAADDTNDGFLRVDEVYGLDLTTTDLVVLSACQTNIGEVSPGDDIVALNRAFLFAGTPTVIASLWNVDDKSTAMLMTRFYGYLDEGWGEAEALRQAQHDLRTEHPEYAHPFYWAAFVLNGDGGPIVTELPLLISQTEPTPSPSPAAPSSGLCASAWLPLALAVITVRQRHRAKR